MTNLANRTADLTDAEIRELEAPVLEAEGEVVELPSLTDEQQPIWAKCLQSRMGLRMLRAMRLLLAGYTFEEVRVFCGYYSTKEIFQRSARFGVAGTTKRLMELQRANTHAALESLSVSILGGEEIKAKDMAIIAGIGHDKVARAEERAQLGSNVQTLANLVQGLVQALGAGSLELRVSSKPETIDVTPSPILLDKTD